MKVLILCDRKSADVAGYNLWAHVEEAIKEKGCEVQAAVVSADEVKPCLGCFGCWVKTPGLCVITNDCANSISQAEMQADALVILSELTYGGFSPDIKAFFDRSIPNISPRFKIHHNEMHHKMRYEKFPCWIVLGYGDSTEEEREIFRELAQRNALNMQPPKHFCLTAQSETEYSDAVRELGRILAEEVGV